MTRLAAIPRTGREAVALVALFSAMMSLIHWGFSMVFAALLVRALARRGDLPVDYRAAGAAACTGFGSVWALGLSSSAALLQANAASMPPGLLAETGVIPFSQTIFLWQSMLCAVTLTVVSTWIAWKTAPAAAEIRTAQALGIDLQDRRDPSRRTRPGEWLEYSPIPALFIALLGAVFLAHEFAAKGFVAAISNLNTYNFLFIVAALVLQWRPRRFVDAVARSVPGTAGVLIQFPFLGAIAAILTGAKNGAGRNPIRPPGLGVHSHRESCDVRADHRCLLGVAGTVRSLGRRQVDHRGALRHACGERPAIQSRLGGADLQRGGGAAQSHQSVLDAAHPGDSRAQGARSHRLHRRAVRDQSAAGAVLLWALGATLPYHPPLAPH